MIFFLAQKKSEGVKINDNFFEWFGNSKLKGVYYHGSTNFGFNSFKEELNEEGFFGAGIYFSDDESNSLQYAKGNKENIYTCFLKMENPFIMVTDVYDQLNYNHWKEIEEDIKQKLNWKSTIKINNEDPIIGKIIQEMGVHEFICWRIIHDNIGGPRFGAVNFTKLLKSKGFDGIITGYNEFIVFSPYQIKSIKNNGNWSKNTSNIYE